MASESGTEDRGSAPAKEHAAPAMGNHQGRKTKGASHAKTAKRHINSRGSNRMGGRLAESLALGDATAEIAEGLSEQLTDLKEKGLEAAKAVEQTIVKHPKTTVLVVFGAGYLWARLRRWL